MSGSSQTIEVVKEQPIVPWQQLDTPADLVGIRKDMRREFVGHGDAGRECLLGSCAWRLEGGANTGKPREFAVKPGAWTLPKARFSASFA